MIVSNIEFTIKKSKRKTVSILIERDGSVSVLVPENLSDDKIQEVILSKEYLIHKNLAEWKQLNDAKVDREYVNGQSFLYLGKNYRLQLVDEQLDAVVLKRGYFLLGREEKDKAKDFFITFYKEKLKEKIPSIVSAYEIKMGVEPNLIKIMELQNRWASCSEKGNVHFHWKCAMAPIEVLHYIVVHELAHLIHANHTPAFWNEVDKVLPNYQQPVQWLKNNGAGMDL